MSNTDVQSLSAFAQDLQQGLSQSPKTLPSKYFYNDEGSQLFEKIMDLPEYYVTNAEFDVLSTHSKAIVEKISKGAKGVRFIELGAGNGLKTKILLESVESLAVNASYSPIDISSEAIQSLSENFQGQFPNIPIQPLVKDYFEGLEILSKSTEYRKVVMFLGSNIGNFSWEESVDLLKHILSSLSKGDLLLIGFDLKKDPRIIRAAYDDSQKVTKAFNINLLKRINEELGGQFDLEAFEHYASYNPVSGEARSYLMSLRAQKVWVEELEEYFEFKQWEPIHTEISRKYDEDSMSLLAEEVGCRRIASFTDAKGYFCNEVWEKQG